MAQSTILNVPSTDAVLTKKVYVEFNFITNYAWERHGSFQNYLPRAVVGIGHNIEVGANLSYTHVSGETQPIEVQPNVKWRFYSNEANETAAAVGCMLYAPVTERARENFSSLLHDREQEAARQIRAAVYRRCLRLNACIRRSKEPVRRDHWIRAKVNQKNWLTGGLDQRRQSPRILEFRFELSN